MYETHSRNRTICLWLYTHARKVCTGKSKASLGSEFEQHSEKLSDADKICLSEKHKGEYSKDQLRAWAHMINMRKYESYDKAPDKPFWKGRKQQRRDDHVLLNSAEPNRKAPYSSDMHWQVIWQKFSMDLT